MSRFDDQGHHILIFDPWAKHVFDATGGFTALVVLIRIGELSVTPLRSSYFHVIGDELSWHRVAGLLETARAAWDGVLFSVASAEDGGGPVADPLAKIALLELTEALEGDRSVINEHHFFDRWGRRMRIEEVTTQ